MPNLGKFAVQAIKEWNPFGPEAITRRAENKAFRKAHRQQKRQEKRMADKLTVTLPDGSTIERTEPLIPARTSTKLAVGGGVVGAFPAVELLQWIQEMQLPGILETITNSSYFLYYGGLVIAYVIARFSKSPLVKQAL